MNIETKPAVGKGFLQVELLRTPEQLRRLEIEAAADKHSPLYATHFASIDGEITGYLSIGAIPFCSYWSHTERMNARKTFELANVMKNLGTLASGGRPVVTCCYVDSPIYPYMAQLGYRKYGDTTLFVQEGN